MAPIHPMSWQPLLTKMRFPKRAALALLTVATALAASTAGAKGQLQTRPTLVEIQPTAAATRFTLANQGDSPVAAQVRVYEWIQAGGEDRLVATDQIVVSPPITQVQPGAEQVVRVVRPGAPATGSDRAYRLVVEELPGAKTDAATAISVRVRYVIPLFVRAAGATKADVSCRLAGMLLTCLNRGGQPAQLGRSSLVDDQGHAVELSAGLFGYVLPISERRWMLRNALVPTLSNTLRLDSVVNGQAITLPVVRSP